MENHELGAQKDKMCADSSERTKQMDKDIHIECSKQFKCNLVYFYGSGQNGPFWAELKLL